MNDNEMVTLPVQRSRAYVRSVATKAGHPDYDAARRWVEAHDRPERRRFLALGVESVPGAVVPPVVAVEDLQPGDRVAGREVDGRPQSDSDDELGEMVVVPLKYGRHSVYGPGSIVVLDGDQ